MLKIFYKLAPFFEDCYREISIREYSRIVKVSPPTASKELNSFFKEGVLLKEEKRRFIFYNANRNSHLFKDLAVAYWRNELYNLFKDYQEDFLYKNIILFGSIARQENTVDSDVDLFVDMNKKEFDFSRVEKKLNRQIQLHFKDSLKNKYLKRNIDKGVKIF